MSQSAPKRKPQRTATAVRLHPDVHARLTAEATAREVSVNFLVNKACAFFLEHLVPVEEMKWTR